MSAEKITKQGTSFLDVKRTSNTYDFPEAFSNYVKSHGAIYFWPQGGFHVVTRAETAKLVMSSPIFSADRSRFFISRMPNMDLSIIKDFFEVVGRMMVMSDGKQHAERRRAAGVGINDNFIQSQEPKIKSTVAELLGPLRENRSIEFAEEVARQLPQSVMADLFCIPREDRVFFNKCSSTMTGFFGGAVEYTNSVGRDVNEAAIAIKGYFKELLAERRQRPQEDFFSKILETQADFGLDDDDLISQAIMMLVAGQVTTTDQICNNAYLMLSRKGVYEKIRQRPEILATATEEFKRCDPAVTFLFRVATADTMLENQPISAGDTIFISNHCINRDATHFENPDEMNIERAPNRHFAYGHGAHYCLGARLGRMQMQNLFGAMLENFPTLRLDSNQEAHRDHYSLAFSGFKALPVVV